MICPPMVNITLLAGGITSWGFLFPFLETKSGQWYHTSSPTSLVGSNGYKVCTKELSKYLLVGISSNNFYQGTTYIRKERITLYKILSMFVCLYL